MKTFTGLFMINWKSWFPEKYKIAVIYAIFTSYFYFIRTVGQWVNI